MNPQITLKDAIITDWLPHPDYSLTYKPEPEYLDYDTVIEVSGCAGNFRRTSLWEVLRKTSRISQYLHQHDDETYDIQKLMESIAHHETFTSAWAAMKGDQRTTMKLTVRKLLQNLQKTGVVPKGDAMKAWDVGRHNELYRVGRKLTPRWAIIAKDSVNLATFVVMTDTCLKHYSDDRIRHTSTGKALPREILRTRLRITPQSYIYAHAKKSFVSVEEGNPLVHEEFQSTMPSAENFHEYIQDAGDQVQSSESKDKGKSVDYDKGYIAVDKWTMAHKGMYRRPTLCDSDHVSNDTRSLNNELATIRKRMIERNTRETLPNRTPKASGGTGQGSTSSPISPKPRDRNSQHHRPHQSSSDQPSTSRCQANGVPAHSHQGKQVTGDNTIEPKSTLSFRGGDGREMGTLRLGPQPLEPVGKARVRHAEWTKTNPIKAASLRPLKPMLEGASGLLGIDTVGNERASCTELIHNMLNPGEESIHVNII